MADIRESFNDAVGNGVGTPNSPLARARASSSDRMSDTIIAQLGADKVAANIAANAACKWGVEVFGRLHNQQWDDYELALDCANKIGGEVVECN
jgi:hypothetical protein